MALERQHVLTKKEKEVMRVVFNQSDKQSGVCLLTPIDFFSKIPLDLEIKEDELEPTLRALEVDGYFDITLSDKKGELIYCINMNQKGLAFARVEKAFRKNLRFRLLLALICGMASAVAGVIIRLIFKATLGS